MLGGDLGVRVCESQKTVNGQKRSTVKRSKTVNRTQEEVIELAHEVATLAKVHDKFKRFKTLEEAMKHKPRVK